ncbi:hexokinase domain-containing protein [Ditylenchus destructor]|uniref:Hexokinase domain-containing protein n=1 Tax=Ditylenchus destructor TaxID=166010 RepID=A0AAD4NIF3_9BILA|nr:hexokinase domain-containing protein [Ditylenchus destructor]
MKAESSKFVDVFAMNWKCQTTAATTIKLSMKYAILSHNDLPISALLRHLGRPCVKVGVGGALIQFHPTYHALLEAQLNSLAPLNIQWELVSADEGSAKGAALIAAVAAKLDL